MRIQHTVPTTTTERPHTVDFRLSTLCVLVRVFNDGQVLAREKAKLLQTRRTYVLHVAEKPTNERARTHLFLLFWLLDPADVVSVRLVLLLGLLGRRRRALGLLALLALLAALASPLLPRALPLVRPRLGP